MLVVMQSAYEAWKVKHQTLRSAASQSHTSALCTHLINSTGEAPLCDHFSDKVIIITELQQ